MQVAAPDRGKLQADSFIAWWRDAGVDYLCADETTDWLAEPVSPPEQAVVNARPAAATPVVPKPTAVIRTDWPSDFAGLMQAIASDPAIPGNGYGRHIAAPVAVAGAALMVLCDFPEEAELAAASLGNGPTGELLKAMVRAMGFDAAQVHIGALAHSRPASGALPPQDASLLADFARHQVAVAKPQKLLLLGSAVSEILTGEDLMAARTNLRNFNHDSRNMAAVATFHPRTLLARPILKAQAWQDLQVLMKKDPS
jgi:uracil-DNA glycosylase